MKTRWKLGFLSSPRALTSQTSYSCIQELSRHETKKWKNMMCVTGWERERERLRLKFQEELSKNAYTLVVYIWEILFISRVWFHCNFDFVYARKSKIWDISKSCQNLPRLAVIYILEFFFSNRLQLRCNFQYTKMSNS